METYQILREIEYTNTGLNNLANEVKQFIPPHTRGMSPEEAKPSGDDVAGLFCEIRGTIDAMAAILSWKNKPSPDFPWWAADRMFSIR